MSKPGTGWCDAGKVPEVMAGEPMAILAADIDLVLVRTSNGLKIFESRCPHQGALLSEGEVKDDLLICRNHRWKFDCESGRRLLEGTPTEPCLKSYPFKVQDGKLWIDLGDDKANPRVSETILRRPEELPGPSGLPLLGNARQLDVARLHLILEDWTKKYGTMYTFRIGRQRLVVVSDPKLISEVLRDRPETYRRGRKLEPVFDELGVSGVFSAEGQAWRPQRKLAMNALAQRNLKGFFPVLRTVAERLRQRWCRLAETGETVDIQAELMRFTVDVTTMLAFGRDVNTLEQEGDDVIQRHMEPIFPMMADRLQAMIPYWRFVRLPRDRSVDSSIAALKAWLSPIVAATRQRLADTPELVEAPTNFLESMLSSTDENGEHFSEERIFGNAMTMLLAGEDTTANTLAWAVHHLLDDAAVVDRLTEEADEKLGTSLVPEDIEVAQSLRFAAAVANETMRLRPVAPLLFADANCDTSLGGVALDPSITVVLLFRPAAVDPDLMPQSDAFMPARWLDAKTHQATQQRQAHMPFGSGPRICPGRSLAILEMNVVLATLYKNFIVERVGEAADVREKFSFTMHPVGLRVRLKSR